MVYVMMMVRFPNDDYDVCKDDGDDALIMMMMMIFLLPELCPTGHLFPFPAQ